MTGRFGPSLSPAHARFWPCSGMGRHTRTAQRLLTPATVPPILSSVSIPAPDRPHGRTADPTATLRVAVVVCTPVKIAYVDEAGCTGALPSATSAIQPVFVQAGRRGRARPRFAGGGEAREEADPPRRQGVGQRHWRALQRTRSLYLVHAAHLSVLRAPARGLRRAGPRRRGQSHEAAERRRRSLDPDPEVRGGRRCLPARDRVACVRDQRESRGPPGCRSPVLRPCSFPWRRPAIAENTCPACTLDPVMRCWARGTAAVFGRFSIAIAEIAQGRAHRERCNRRASGSSAVRASQEPGPLKAMRTGLGAAPKIYIGKIAGVPVAELGGGFRAAAGAGLSPARPTEVRAFLGSFLPEAQLNGGGACRRQADRRPLADPSGPEPTEDPRDDRGLTRPPGPRDDS